MNHLRVVLQVFKEHQFVATYRKCVFWLSLVAFLGHIISSNGVEVAPKKNKMMKNCPRPLASMNIRKFLFQAVYYRKFVDGSASIDSPLKNLTQKNVKFE